MLVVCKRNGITVQKDISDESGILTRFSDCLFILENDELMNVDGVTTKIKNDMIPNEIQVLHFEHFAYMSKEFINKLKVKVISENWKDTPYYVWKIRKIFQKNLRIHSINKLYKDYGLKLEKKNFLDLFNMICIESDFEFFEYICHSYFTEEFLIENQGYLLRLFAFLSFSRLEIQKMRDITRWMLNFELTSILKVVLAIVPSSLLDFCTGVAQLSNVNLRGTNINELTYLTQVCDPDFDVYHILFDVLIKSGINFNTEIVVDIFNDSRIDSFFKGRKFIEGIEHAVMNWKYFFLPTFINLCVLTPEYDTRASNYVRDFVNSNRKEEFLSNINVELIPLTYQFSKLIRIEEETSNGKEESSQEENEESSDEDK